jgi:rRNA-processing protein FCF1
LVDRIVRASAAGRLPGRVVVVLEGTGASGVSEGEIHAGSRTSVHVVHAAGSGDDQLVDLATAAGPTRVGVVVVTADRELRQRIAAVGGSAVGPSWLYDRLGDEA